MQAQDMQTLFQNIPAEMQHSVDLSVDDLMEYMDAWGAFSGTHMVSHSGSSTLSWADIEGIMQMAYNDVSLKERQLIGVSLRILMNMMLKNIPQWTDGLEAVFPPGMAQAVVHARDERVVEYVLSHSDTTVVIPYGQLHFDGIYQWLRREDEQWKIESIEPAIPYPVFPL